MIREPVNLLKVSVAVELYFGASPRSAARGRRGSVFGSDQSYRPGRIYITTVL